MIRFGDGWPPRPDQSAEDIASRLTRDAEYRVAFTKLLEARSLDAAILDRLIRFARERQATLNHATMRGVLTAAGVSWEAL